MLERFQDNRSGFDLSPHLEGATEDAGAGEDGAGPMLKALGGASIVHPLGESFYVQTSDRCGDCAAKLRLVPMSLRLRPLTAPGSMPAAA